MHINQNYLTPIKRLPLVSALFICGLISLFVGCSKDKEDASKQTTLTLVTSADYPPFEFMRSSQIVGLDIDVATAITQELGLLLQVQDMNFSGLIPALTTGRADFAMAGLTITPERAQNVEFSDVYFQPALAILAREDAPITNIAALAGKRIGAQLGSTMEQFAKEQATQMQGITITSLNRNPDLVQELKVGRLDAVLLEAAQASAFAQVSPDLVFSILPKAIAGYAIAFPKDSPWVSKFNEAIARLRAEGKLQAIETEWLTIETEPLHD